MRTLGSPLPVLFPGHIRTTGKAEKVHFPVAIVLYDVEMQSTSVPLIQRVKSHLVTSAKGHMNGMFLLSETARSGCNADHHFGNVTSCV